MAWLTSRVPDCRLSMTWRISSTESWVRWARLRTSSATTAKPRPASPARAASIAALSASRLVCPAMAQITSSTEPICSLLSARPCSRCMAWPMSWARASMAVVVWAITPRPCWLARSAWRAASAAWAALWAEALAAADISCSAVAT
ncbi:hypothetical protein D3C81_1306140 [compost metagenome]